MRTRDPTYLSVGFGAFFAIIWIYRNGELLRGLWVQKWRNKDKLRRAKVHRNVRVLSLKRRRVFVRWHLTSWRRENAPPHGGRAAGQAPRFQFTSRAKFA
jgi:hypothetical protein